MSDQSEHVGGSTAPPRRNDEHGMASFRRFGHPVGDGRREEGGGAPKGGGIVAVIEQGAFRSRLEPGGGAGSPGCVRAWRSGSRASRHECRERLHERDGLAHGECSLIPESRFGTKWGPGT